MEIVIPLSPELSLKIASNVNRGRDYPTTRLQKGLLLVLCGQELAEEAVGFGVPVLKRGIETIFPGDVELKLASQGETQVITAIFSMNLEEKIAHPEVGVVNNKLLYTIKNTLAAFIRRFPLVRGLLTAISNTLRSLFAWETAYEAADFCTKVKIVYTLTAEAGRLQIEVDVPDLSQDGITEVIVMNEQGAQPFDYFVDSDGNTLRGKEIGCWDEVTAAQASFISDAYHLAFTLNQVNGARLFRGRELIGSRLAWAGFGYSFPPTVQKFSYKLSLTRRP